MTVQTEQAGFASVPASYSQLLARFAVAQRSGLTGLPGADETIRNHIIDVLGNSLAASVTQIADITATVVQNWGGAADATAIGLRGSFPAAAVALHNGSLAHALDFDDTHLPSVVHPSASVIPAVLAAGERLGRTFAEVVPAIAVGLEITNRLGMAGYDAESNDSVFFDRGLHATSICGTLGVAAAVALLNGGDEAVIRHAIGIAASMGAGLLEANRSGGTVKKAHCGWAAHSGLVAAELALAGLTGPPTVLEGRFGFLQAHCGDRVDTKAITEDLGSAWTIGGIGFKPYPCNIYTHAAIDAALQLRGEGVTAGDLDWVHVGVAAPTLRTIAEPPERKAAPATGYEGQFSGPYTFASALLGGGGLGVYLEDFTDEAVADPARKLLASKVRFAADDDATTAFPLRVSANIRYGRRDGTEGELLIPSSRGFGEKRLTADEVLTKFSLNAAQALPAESLGRVLDVLPELGGLRIGEVLGMLRTPSPDRP